MLNKITLAIVGNEHSWGGDQLGRKKNAEIYKKVTSYGSIKLYLSIHHDDDSYYSLSANCASAPMLSTTVCYFIFDIWRKTKAWKGQVSCQKVTEPIFKVVTVCLQSAISSKVLSKKLWGHTSTWRHLKLNTKTKTGPPLALVSKWTSPTWHSHFIHSIFHYSNFTIH